MMTCRQVLGAAFCLGAAGFAGGCGDTTVNNDSDDTGTSGAWQDGVEPCAYEDSQGLLWTYAYSETRVAVSQVAGQGCLEVQMFEEMPFLITFYTGGRGEAPRDWTFGPPSERLMASRPAGIGMSMAT